MQRTRVCLVASPMPRSPADFRDYRAADVIETIRRASDGFWVGWRQNCATADDTFESARRAPPAWLGYELTRAELHAVRNLVSQQILWPILNGRPDLMRYDERAYQVFLDANRQLAHDLRPYLSPDAPVWVNDFVHIPLGSALREEGFAGPMGFLLHAHFPTGEQLLALPKARELLEQLCRYDLIGFQSEGCRTNFRAAVSAVAEFDGEGGSFKCSESTRTGVFPVPIDAAALSRFAASEVVRDHHRRVRDANGGKSIIGSWSTLNEVHGLTNQLQSFERLLVRQPHRRSAVVLMQAILPPYLWIGQRETVRCAVEQEFTRINGRFETLDWTPIHHFHPRPDISEITALYRASDVGLVTPLCEGISLTAKEFVAAQDPESPGVLVLSRFAGCAGELEGAISVNPYDIGTLTSALEQALDMPLLERRARWKAMIESLGTVGVQEWSRTFLVQLRAVHGALSATAAA